MDLEFVDRIVATSGGAGGQRASAATKATAPINRIAARTDPSLYATQILLRIDFIRVARACLLCALRS
jgi:hypothetical protein